jgi:hypothetical protein
MPHEFAKFVAVEGQSEQRLGPRGGPVNCLRHNFNSLEADSEAPIEFAPTERGRSTQASSALITSELSWRRRPRLTPDSRATVRY